MEEEIIKSANDTMMQLHNEVMQLNKYLEASYVCYENMLNRYLKLQDRIDKAIEYIEKRKNLNWYADGVFVYELLNILQGVDKE